MIDWRKNQLNESSSYDMPSGNEDIIEKLGEIDIFDEGTKNYKKVKASDLIKVCNDGVYKMMRDYPYLISLWQNVRLCIFLFGQVKFVKLCVLIV